LKPFRNGVAFDFANYKLYNLNVRNLIFRLFLIIITAVIFFVVGEFAYYDFVVAILLLIGLVLNYKTTANKYDTISNYLFWIIMFALITI
jgi:predicted membrane protein